MRLDSFLVEAHHISRAQAKAWILDGKIKVDEQIIKKPSHLLIGKESVSVNPSAQRPLEPNCNPNPISLDIIYEDDAILILNKPPGLVTHPTESYPEKTCVNGLIHYGVPLSTEGGALRPGIVHRLDKDTEGLMIIAKTDEAYLVLKQQFKERSILKYYRALIKGQLSQERVVVEKPIKRIKRSGKMVCVSCDDPNAKYAKTIFTTQSKTTTMSCIEAELITGRTHQIRVHLASLGHPILGDSLYGKSSKKYSQGQVLQAFKLKFKHPTKKTIFTIELPPSSRFYS